LLLAVKLHILTKLHLYLYATIMLVIAYSLMGGYTEMNRNLFAVCLLSFALAGVASAQATASSAENGTHYTHAQLKEMARNAQTPAQYSALAAYYGDRQMDYLQLAAKEKQEWVRRSQNAASIGAKYPRPADSARYLYEYYTTMAAKSGQLAAKYGQLPAPMVLASAK
jgi:hypothetical protein